MISLVLQILAQVSTFRLDASRNDKQNSNILENLETQFFSSPFVVNFKCMSKLPMFVEFNAESIGYYSAKGLLLANSHKK